MNEQNPPIQNNIFEYFGFKAVTGLSSILALNTRYALAGLCADLYFKLDRGARENVCANLSAVLLPDAAPSALRSEARRVFHSFGRYLVEFFGAHVLSDQYIDRHVLVAGREHIDTALKAGHGALFVSGHYSNWELGAAVVARMGYPITAITQMHAHPKVNALFVEQRTRRGVRVAHSIYGARAALKALQQNETVAILGDRPTGGATVEAGFFGRRTALPLGPWRIALSSGAALLPTFMSRREDGYLLEIGAPLNISDYTGTSEIEKSQALAQAWTVYFEERVRKDPGQWEAFYPVFKP
jgi:KDO2-lipid IV(A) lauroyltransferase